MSAWKRVKDSNPYLKVYVHDVSGDVRVVYPKAPRWAQKVAHQIYNDIQTCGMPTSKGLKTIVRGTWAKMISEAAKERS